MAFNRRGFLAALTAGAGGAKLSQALPKTGLKPFSIPTSTQAIPTRGEKPDVDALIAHMVNRIQFTHYDRLRIPKRTRLPGAINLFQVPMYSPDPFTNQIKTEADTSMRSAGMFLPPFDFILQRYGFVLSEGDESIIRSSFSWKMMILMKSFNHGPMLLRDGSFFVDLDKKNGAKYIPPLVNFSLVINTGRLVGERLNFDLDLVGTLSGLMDRPVQ